MKKFVWLLGMMLACGTLSAQRISETVYLKNGSIIKGTIVEEVPGQSLKIQTRDGSVFVYKMDEVERITKEQAVDKETQSTGHRGLDFNVDLGYDIATKGGGGSFAAELGLGKRLNKNFYAGIGAGAFIPTGDGDVSIPIYADFKGYFPLNGTKIAPWAGVKLGYVINTGSDESYRVGKQWITVENPNYVMVSVMPGVQIPLSSKVDFNLGVGYTHFIPTGGGDGSGAIAIRAGFGFHKGLNKPQPKPIRNSGFQLTIEGNGVNPWSIDQNEDGGYSSAGLTMALGYKWSPNLSFALGYGVSYYDAGCEGTETSTNRYGEVYNEKISGNSYGTMHKAFLRGQYRLNDKKFSPFASLDLGWRFRTPDCDDFYDWANESIHGWNDEDEGEYSSTTNFFIAPAVGFSWRTTNNSYFEMKVGYEISKIGSKKIGNDNHFFDYDAISMSGLSIGIGWTHTFNLFAR